MKVELSKPINDHALVVYYLIINYHKGITMADMCREYFYKFQSRLGEVEKGREKKMKIIRLPMVGKKRTGAECRFLNYKSVAPLKYLVNLYNYLNKPGVKTIPSNDKTQRKAA